MAEINLGGSVGVAGAPILGQTSVEITGNADLVLTPVQYTNYFIDVTSDGTSTGPRQVIAPLVQGSFLVKNSTTEGYPITFIGPTGTGVSVPINITAICASDGTNFVLPNANSATVAPTNTGAVETTGQPVTNQETLGSHLQIKQDTVGSQCDGTYGDGTRPWNVGVWSILGSSIIRTPGLDNTKPIMRIPLSAVGGHAYNKRPQWDKPSNRLYVPDENGPRIYVIDTTPQVDPTGSYVAGCPGIVQTVDLSTTPLTSGYVMVADIATATFWCFQGTTAVSIPFSGLTHQTYVLPEHVLDAYYANGHVWVHSYNGSFNQYLHSLAPNGTLNAGVLIRATAAAPVNAAGLMTFDLVNNVLWVVANDSNPFGTIYVLGVDPVYPTPTTLYSWSNALIGDVVYGPVTAHNGNLILAGGLNFGGAYSPTGTFLGYVGVVAGGPFNVGSEYLIATVYDPIGLTQYFFSENNVSALLLRGILNPAGGVTVYEYLGGLQEWVAGGGGTNLSYVFINEDSYLDPINEAAASQLIQWAGDFPVLGGTALSLTTGIGPNYTNVSGLTGFNLDQNTEGGATITITGAHDPLNNGTFPFTASRVNASLGSYYNTTPGALPDANNGSIHWTIQYIIQFAWPNSGPFGPKFLDFTQVTGFSTVTEMLFYTTDSPSVDLMPFIRQSPFIMVGWDGTDAVDVQAISLGAGGGSGPGDLVFTAAVFTNNRQTPLVTGSRYVDLTLFSGSPVFKFVADLSVTSGNNYAQAQLYNVTDSEYVTGTLLSTNNLLNTELTSSALTVGGSPGNLKTGKVYEVHLSLESASVDRAIMMNARITA